MFEDVDVDVDRVPYGPEFAEEVEEVVCADVVGEVLDEEGPGESWLEDWVSECGVLGSVAYRFTCGSSLLALFRLISWSKA